MRLFIRGLLIIALMPLSVSLIQAQDDPGITAPDTYQIDWLGIPRSESSQFAVSLDFDGVDKQGEPLSVELDSRVILQPDPPAFELQAEATGDLAVFRLVPFGSEQRVVANQIVYERRLLHTYVSFPDATEFSCGQSVSGGAPAIRRLEQQTPLPERIFQSLPEVERILPDAEFDGQLVARYVLDEVRTDEIEAGRLTVHILPEIERVVYFAFEGYGEFLLNDYRATGHLRYSYTLQPLEERDTYDFRPVTVCDPPQVRGVAVFEPSAEWIVRDDYGSYLTNQSVRRLLEFHSTSLGEAGFELVGPPIGGFGSTTVTYRAPDGAFVDIALYDGLDGTLVEIQFHP